MTKVKLILGGITGAVGLAGAALVPSLMSSENKVNSGGKAVAKSWATGTHKGTSFKSFGDAFAPFLVDVDRTDDAFWKARSEQTKSVGFESGKIFSDWNKISDTNARISKIKEGCRSFQNSELRYSDIVDVETTMSLCGIYDATGQKPKFSTNTTGLTISETWTAEQVCKLFIGNSSTIKDECKKISVDAPSA